MYVHYFFLIIFFLLKLSISLDKVQTRNGFCERIFHLFLFLSVEIALKCKMSRRPIYV